MHGMPLLLAVDKPLLGPLVPVFGRFKKIRSEGMAQGDRVVVWGLSGELIEMVVELTYENQEVVKDLHSFQYVQAQRFGTGPAIHVWLENPTDGTANGK